jgi:hypothetical protein
MFQVHCLQSPRSFTLHQLTYTWHQAKLTEDGVAAEELEEELVGVAADLGLEGDEEVSKLDHLMPRAMPISVKVSTGSFNTGEEQQSILTPFMCKLCLFCFFSCDL